METKTVMDTDMVNINQETLFKKVEFPYVVPVEDLKHIHPYIKSLFCAIKNVEKLYRELKNSDKRHRNSVVSRKLYGIISLNSSIEKHPKLSQIKSGRKDSSTEGNSRDVEQPNHLEGELISNIFLVEKKDEENRPVIKLKHLNQFIP